MQIYWIILTGIKERYSSVIALYVDSCIVRGFFLSWRDTPPQYCECSIWYPVGFYTMHTFLNLLVESQFESFLKLIINFWYHS
jgi:hypothetical protein